MKKKFSLIIWISALLALLVTWAYSHFHQCLFELVYKGTFHINNEVHKGNFHSYTFWYPELDRDGITVVKNEIRPTSSTGSPVSYTLFRGNPMFQYAKHGSERSIEYSVPFWIPFFILLFGATLSALRTFRGNLGHNNKGCSQVEERDLGLHP